MAFKHRYETRCPACGLDMTGEDCAVLVCGLGKVELPTHLDKAGILLDVEHQIEMGQHCGTLCGQCGEPLDEIEQEEPPPAVRKRGAKSS